MFFKIGVLNNITIHIGKHPCWSLFLLESLFIKFAVLKACSSIKKRLQRRCFPVNIDLVAASVNYTKPFSQKKNYTKSSGKKNKNSLKIYKSIFFNNL